MSNSNIHCGEINNKQNVHNNESNFVPCFLSIPPKQFALLSSLLGLLLIDNLDLDQQNSLGNFVVNIGQSILTAAAQGQALQSDNQKYDQTRWQIEMLKKQIVELEQQLS
jgi:hypothetical protein